MNWNSVKAKLPQEHEITLVIFKNGELALTFYTYTPWPSEYGGFEKYGFAIDDDQCKCGEVVVWCSIDTPEGYEFIRSGHGVLSSKYLLRGKG